MDYNDIKISIIGGPGDGKTTFISSMITSMVYDVVSINGHSIHLEPLEMNKGFTVEEKKGSGTIEQKDVETVDKTSFSDMMNSLQTNAPTSHRETTNDENGKIEVSDASGEIQLQHELEKQFTLRRNGVAVMATGIGQYITLTFEVQLDGNSICTLTVVDYAGEVVAFETGREPNELLLESFSQQISDCNAAVILANAVKLSENTERNPMFSKARLKKTLNVDRITAVLSHAKANSPFCFLVDISQSRNPRVSDNISADNYRNTAKFLQEEMFDTLFKQAAAKAWAVGILPIDAFGRNCVDENNQLKKYADFAPIGIDKSILFCLYNVSQYYDKMIQDEINSIHVPLFGAGRAAALKTRNKLLDQRRKYAELRAAIKSDEHYFDDVYEKNMTSTAQT